MQDILWLWFIWKMSSRFMDFIHNFSSYFFQLKFLFSSTLFLNIYCHFVSFIELNKSWISILMAFKFILLICIQLWHCFCTKCFYIWNIFKLLDYLFLVHICFCNVNNYVLEQMLIMPHNFHNVMVIRSLSILIIVSPWIKSFSQMQELLVVLVFLPQFKSLNFMIMVESFSQIHDLFVVIVFIPQFKSLSFMIMVNTISLICELFLF